MRTCISCLREIDDVQKALRMDDEQGLTYLVCGNCVLEAMPNEAPARKARTEWEEAREKLHNLTDTERELMYAKWLLNQQGKR